MKRFFLTYLTLITLTTCNINAEKKNTIIKSDTTIKGTDQKADKNNSYKPIETAFNRDSSIAKEFKIFKIYALTDTIKADLNGDKILDCAYINQNDNKEIFIIDGKTKAKNKIGADKSFSDIGTVFNWVDFWGITDDKETYEILIKDSEIVGNKKTKLDNTSLFLRKEEVGGGVITYIKGQYVWVHQSD